MSKQTSEMLTQHQLTYMQACQCRLAGDESLLVVCATELAQLYTSIAADKVAHLFNACPLHVSLMHTPQAVLAELYRCIIVPHQQQDHHDILQLQLQLQWQLHVHVRSLQSFTAALADWITVMSW